LSDAWLAAVLVMLGVSCRGADVPVAQPASFAPKPSSTTSEPAPTNEGGEEPPGLLGMVVGNVASTDLSALVTITSARIEGPNGGPAPSSGYVNHVYVVDVVTCIYGCSNVKTFTFAEMAEAGIATQKVGAAMLLSVCRDAPGKYHTPDVGYFIPASELPASAVSDLAAKPPARAASVCTPP
jgi:hypothetical protein